MISLALVNEHGLLLLHRRKGSCIYCIAAISGDVFAQMRCAKTTARDTTLWFMLCFWNQIDPKKVHSKFMRVQSFNVFAYHDSTGVGRGHISTSSVFSRTIIAVTEKTEEAKRQCPKSKKSHPWFSYFPILRLESSHSFCCPHLIRESADAGARCIATLFSFVSSIGIGTCEAVSHAMRGNMVRAKEIASW